MADFCSCKICISAIHGGQMVVYGVSHKGPPGSATATATGQKSGGKKQIPR